MDFTNYLPVLLIIVMAVVFAAINLLASGLLGPKRSGDVKDSTYESGMNPIGTARKRFNIRFYILAMTFLVFDIEIIFLYPWAVVYRTLGFLGLVEMGVFLGVLMVGFVYAWANGALDWK